FGTVGLSTGLTPQLTAGCRLWIIATMFVGRLGPLTLVLSFLTAKHPHKQYAEGRVMIG
ncbi:MAG: potassium transporter TrkG, partial [Verrucomicrobiota bacterium]